MARTGLAVVAVFVVWSLLNYVLHGVLLASSYAASAQLWRPVADMTSKLWLVYFVTLVSSAGFVGVYALFITEKSMKTALLYGLIVGVWAGVSMGYGTYAVAPIPYGVALGWFLGALVIHVAGGAVMALVLRKA